jgi:hypothetical protein
MIRVCRPGGRVLVADVAVESSKSDAYDRLEIMRDPSHTHALTHEEFAGLFLPSGLSDCRRSAYGVDIELESQMRASFPKPGDETKMREMITADIGRDDLGIAARREARTCTVSVPLRLMVHECRSNISRTPLMGNQSVYGGKILI